MTMFKRCKWMHHEDFQKFQNLKSAPQRLLPYLDVQLELFKAMWIHKQSNVFELFGLWLHVNSFDKVSLHTRLTSVVRVQLLCKGDIKKWKLALFWHIPERELATKYVNKAARLPAMKIYTLAGLYRRNGLMQHQTMHLNGIGWLYFIWKTSVWPVQAVPGWTICIVTLQFEKTS